MIDDFFLTLIKLWKYLWRVFQVPVDQASITLGDFKRCIDRKQNFKYFFQSFDEDYGLVKEEITADSMPLPQTQEGKIVCFLTPGEEAKVCFHFFASKKP